MADVVSARGRPAGGVHHHEDELPPAGGQLGGVEDLQVGPRRVDAVAVRVPVDPVRPALAAVDAGTGRHAGRAEVEGVGESRVVDDPVGVGRVRPRLHDTAVVGGDDDGAQRARQHRDLVLGVVPDGRRDAGGRPETHRVLDPVCRARGDPDPHLVLLRGAGRERAGVRRRARVPHPVGVRVARDHDARVGIDEVHPPAPLAGHGERVGVALVAPVGDRVPERDRGPRVRVAGVVGFDVDVRHDERGSRGRRDHGRVLGGVGVRGVHDRGLAARRLVADRGLVGEDERAGWRDRVAAAWPLTGGNDRSAGRGRIVAGDAAIRTDDVRRGEERREVDALRPGRKLDARPAPFDLECDRRRVAGGDERSRVVVAVLLEAVVDERDAVADRLRHRRHGRRQTGLPGARQPVVAHSQRRMREPVHVEADGQVVVVRAGRDLRLGDVLRHTVAEREDDAVGRGPRVGVVGEARCPRPTCWPGSPSRSRRCCTHPRCRRRNRRCWPRRMPGAAPSTPNPTPPP